LEHVHRTLSRRGLLTGVTAGAAAAAAAIVPRAAEAQTRAFPRFRRTVDLTHTFSPEFPTFFGTPGIAIKKLKDFKNDGFNLAEWTVLEHAGTHIDAPIHFAATGAGPAEIPLDQLVVPLAVIDVSAKAAENADYQLTPADIAAWERRYGRLPRGGCVAMNSGWDKHVASPRYVGKDDRGGLHFPGFHPETTAMLVERRTITGLAVDTLSLDHGPSKDFRTHYAWLPSGRWGLENVAGLGSLPARGATLVVGAPKVKGATGGPTRVIALV
jgi:kynurenine formamidase